jgi:phage gp36-like protein
VPLYANLADLQARYEDRDLLQLTDENDTGQIDQGKIDEAIADASTEISSHVARRHKDLDLLADDPTLKRLCCIIAYYNLWNDDVPDKVHKKYRDAKADLVRISKGEIVLDEGAEVSPPRDNAIHTGGSGKKFSRDSLGGY